MKSGATEISPTTDKSYKREQIARHPFFADFNPHFLHLLDECANIETFGPGQPIFQERGHADHFYLILKGHIALETFVPGKGETCVQTLAPGDAMGWSWMFPPYEWQFSARALESCEVIVFGAAGLLERAEKNREFGHELYSRVVKIMVKRLQATRKKLLEFYRASDSQE